MARTNVHAEAPVTLTHEGGVARRSTPLAELRRSVLAALLFEDTFYEGGESLAARIAALVPQVEPEAVAALAIEARDAMYLRHVPLFLVRELARIAGQGTRVADTLERVIQRPDELTEYLAIYWKGQKDTEKSPLSAGSKRGLARAYRKFSAHALAKYDRDNVVKLRDVLRLTHAKPKDADQGATWKRVIARDLESPDTWEVALSAGKDKRETFERLLRERKLGGLAFLRNLRNMIESDVDAALIRERCSGPFEKVLPFRFIAAVRHAPAFATELNEAMLGAMAGAEPLPGRTVVVVDVSQSMDVRLSRKSEMTRLDAAAGLAVLARELGDVRVFSFSERLCEVPAYRGLALVEAIHRSQTHLGTRLGEALRALDQLATYDRVIVVTDEQAHDSVGRPTGKGYMVNVATYQHGVGEGPWTRIDGWSERILDYVRAVDAELEP
jgi:TROVE domain-containing protein